jgi:hypothetical protein
MCSAGLPADALKLFNDAGSSVEKFDELMSILPSAESFL